MSVDFQLPVLELVAELLRHEPSFLVIFDQVYKLEIVHSRRNYYNDVVLQSGGECLCASFFGGVIEG